MNEAGASTLLAIVLRWKRLGSKIIVGKASKTSAVWKRRRLSSRCKSRTPDGIFLSPRHVQDIAQWVSGGQAAVKMASAASPAASPGPKHSAMDGSDMELPEPRGRNQVRWTVAGLLCGAALLSLLAFLPGTAGTRASVRGVISESP